MLGSSQEKKHITGVDQLLDLCGPALSQAAQPGSWWIEGPAKVPSRTMDRKLSHSMIKVMSFSDPSMLQNTTVRLYWRCPGTWHRIIQGAWSKGTQRLLEHA